jgi:hypothetical protein
VSNEGKVVERFLCLYHIKDTTSEALKLALIMILDHYKLPISRLRGQGYDGASNMRGEINCMQQNVSRRKRMLSMSIALPTICNWLLCMLIVVACILLRVYGYLSLI